MYRAHRFLVYSNHRAHHLISSHSPSTNNHGAIPIRITHFLCPALQRYRDPQENSRRRGFPQSNFDPLLRLQRHCDELRDRLQIVHRLDGIESLQQPDGQVSGDRQGVLFCAVPRCISITKIPNVGGGGGGEVRGGMGGAAL